MRILARLITLYCLVHPAGAAEIDKFDGTKRFTVGSTRLLIYNHPTYQCGWRLVFDEEATVRQKDGNISLSVKTIPAEKGECGCKARTNDFHLYRVRRVNTDKRWFPYRG